MRKVTEIKENPHVSLTFWFELMQREVILEALIEVLSEEENKAYWLNYPRIAQLGLLAYVPTSGHNQSTLSKCWKAKKLL